MHAVVLEYAFVAAARVIRNARLAWARAEAFDAAGVTREWREWLASRDLLVRWHRPDGEFWTLTPWGARQSHLVIDEVKVLRGIELEGIPHWVARPSAMKGRGVRVRRRPFEVELKFPELVVDPLPPPDEIVAEEESPTEVRLFQGRRPVQETTLRGGVGAATAGGGIPIRVDRRMGKRVG